MGVIKRAIKEDLTDLKSWFIDLFNIDLKAFKKLFHIHSWKHESTERGRITLFEKLYDANGWDKNYVTNYYRCSKCGKFKSENY